MIDRPSKEQVDAAIDATGRVYAFSAEEWRVFSVRLAAEVQALRAELSECRAQLEKARADVVAASRELLVEAPEPGTDMGRVMIANALMRRERNLFRDASEAAELRIVELRAELEGCWDSRCEIAAKLWYERTRADGLDGYNERLREELERAKYGDPDDWQRLVTIVDEAYGMQPRMLTGELLTFLEHQLHDDIAENNRLQESIDLYRATITRVEALLPTDVLPWDTLFASDVVAALKGGEP
jgi:hypothetical protein